MNFKKLICTLITVTSLSLSEISTNPLIVNDFPVPEHLVKKTREILSIGPEVEIVELPEPLLFELLQALKDYDDMVSVLENEGPIAISKKRFFEVMNKKIAT